MNTKRRSVNPASNETSLSSSSPQLRIRHQPPASVLAHMMAYLPTSSLVGYDSVIGVNREWSAAAPYITHIILDIDPCMLIITTKTSLRNAQHLASTIPSSAMTPSSSTTTSISWEHGDARGIKSTIVRRKDATDRPKSVFSNGFERIDNHYAARLLRKFPRAYGIHGLLGEHLSPLLQLLTKRLAESAAIRTPSATTSTSINTNGTDGERKNRNGNSIIGRSLSLVTTHPLQLRSLGISPTSSWSSLSDLPSILTLLLPSLPQLTSLHVPPRLPYTNDFFGNHLLNLTLRWLFDIQGLPFVPKSPIIHPVCERSLDRSFPSPGSIMVNGFYPRECLDESQFYFYPIETCASCGPALRCNKCRPHLSCISCQRRVCQPCMKTCICCMHSGCKMCLGEPCRRCKDDPARVFNPQPL
jgi:hypothetical protein